MQYFVPIIFISGSVKEKKEVQNKTTKTILQARICPVFQHCADNNKIK
jgi:hypothetical protein